MLSISKAVILLATLGFCASSSAASTRTTDDRPSHVWGDFNGDSLADLFIPGAKAGGRLLVNLGDGSFRDVTVEVGLDPELATIQALWSDFDRDDDLDLLLLSGESPARIFENELGSFRDVSLEVGLQHSGADLRAEWTDFDSDLRPDLLLTQDGGVLLYRGVRGDRMEQVDLSGSALLEGDRFGSTDQGQISPVLYSPFMAHPEASNRSDDTTVQERMDNSVHLTVPYRSGGEADRIPLVPTEDTSAFAPSFPAIHETLRGLNPLIQCAHTIHDQATGGCITASTDPLEGMLYPLSKDLFVAPNGDVGIGITSPRGDLHVTGKGKGLAVISPDNQAGVEASELMLANSALAAGGFRFINTTSGALRLLKIRGVNALNDPYVSILGGLGHFGLNVDVPLYRLHAFEETSQPQIVADGGTGSAQMRILADSDKLGGARQARLSLRHGDTDVGRIGYWNGVGEMIVSNETSNTLLALKNNGEVHVTDRDGGLTFVADGGVGSSEIVIRADSGSMSESNQPRLTLTQDGGQVEGRLGFFSGSNDLTLSNEFGTSNLHLTSDGKVQARNDVGLTTIELEADDLNGSAFRMFRDDGVETVALASDVANTGSGFLRLRDAAGLNAIVLDGNSGTTTTRVISVTGGADVAEPFNIAGEAVLPGMVVAIDPTRPGELRLTSTPYDKTVAGIVSGAGGIQPGLMLSQEGTIADGKFPVALSGRVYCLADASNGPIAPGDMLTSSTHLGHAMKASDSGRSFGAVIGKAMTALESGTGLVLVLVNLQ